MSNDIKKFLDQSGVTILWSRTVEKVESEADRAQKAEKVNADAIEAIQKDYLKAADKEEVVAYVDNKVGTVPEGSTVMGIIQNIQENAYDDTELRGLVENKADKTQVATDIAAAVKVETDARVEAVAAVQGEVDELEQAHATDKKNLEDAIALKADKSALDAIAEDYLKAADKQELEGKINAKADQSEVDAIKEDYLKAADKQELEGKIDDKADQTALDAVSAVANAAATKVALKAEEDRAKGEEARIEGLVTAEAERAAGVEAGLEARIETMEVFWDTTEDTDGVVNKLKEIQDYIASDESGAAAMAGNIQANTQAIAAMDEAYKAADAALQATVDELAATVEEKAVQADWNQNDETAPDYIKNRPFYDEVTEVAIIEETTYDFNGGYGYGYNGECGNYFAPPTQLTVLETGKKYKFIFDGNEYVLTAVSGNVYSGKEEVVLGNLFYYGIYDDNNVYEDNGLPFMIYYGSDTYLHVLVPRIEDLNEHTFSLYAIEEGSVKQLDEKYIPDTIARVADLTDATGRVDVLESEMDAVEGRLDVVEPKVETLESEMDAVQAAVATKAEAQALADAVSALEGVDAGQETRIAALEAKFGEGEGNVESQIAAAVADEAAAREAADAELEAAIAQALQDAKDDSADRDIVVLAEAQKNIETAEQNAKDFATGLNNSLAERVGTLEGTAANKTDLTALETRVKAVEDELAGFEAITAEELEEIFNSVE